ncbi:MAG: hypothetical protein AABZ39_13670 [Spirochaetota bacterium]
MGVILFFDDWPLCYAENVRRVMGKPKWVPEATLEDVLTEGTWNFPFVWFDKKDRLWKAIYCAAVPDGERRPEGWFPRKQGLMYAESNDGIAWQRPDVSSRRDPSGVYVAPNQVFGTPDHIDGAPVFLDEHDPDPKRRFKYLFCAHGKKVQGLATSPDGIFWTIDTSVTMGDYTLDSPITGYYNHVRDSYCISRRLHCGDRRVALFETKDWKNFSMPEIVMHPDAEDPPLMQFYGMPVYRYENMYLGLLWRLHCHPTEELVHKGNVGGPLDCALAYSFDGWHFFRATHAPLIPVNERGEHGGGCIYTGAMTVGEDNIIRFYSGGSKAEHFQDQTLSDAALMLHTMRLDGFFRLESYVTKAKIMTRSVVFTGERLMLNVRAPHGRVRVEICENDGTPVSGYTFDECIPFTGDELFWQVKWRSKTTAALVSGRRYHIAVELMSAELYAIRGDIDMVYGSGHEHVPLRYRI